MILRLQSAYESVTSFSAHVPNQSVISVLAQVAIQRVISTLTIESRINEPSHNKGVTSIYEEYASMFSNCVLLDDLPVLTSSQTQALYRYAQTDEQTGVNNVASNKIMICLYRQMTFPTSRKAMYRAFLSIKLN